MAHWTDEYKQLAADCLTRNTQLNDWERGFLINLNARLDQHKLLTANQIEKLDQIWQRVTQKGFTPIR